MKLKILSDIEKDNEVKWDFHNALKKEAIKWLEQLRTEPLEMSAEEWIENFFEVETK